VIPFNVLGKVFSTFGHFIYPKSVREALCTCLETLEKDAKVLDVGAGTGLLCEFAYACRDDLVYVALDPYEGMLKYAKDFVETKMGTAEDLPFEENSFDVLMMGEALHHFKDVELALSEVVRVLKPEGKLFIYDFDKSTFRGKSICKGEKLLGEPGNFFDPKVLKEKLQGYGFQVETQNHAWRYTLCATLHKS